MLSAPEQRKWDGLCDLLDRLHRPKDAAYGDAWCRRGETIGIFANIARKYDRLANQLDRGVATRAESLGDTVADLTVYAAKYVTWLASEEPAEVDVALSGIDTSSMSRHRGPDALSVVLDVLPAWSASRGSEPPASQESAWKRVREDFSDLEQTLMHQAGETDAVPVGTLTKPTRAISLTWHSGWLLLRVDESDPQVIDELKKSIEAME